MPADRRCPLPAMAEIARPSSAKYVAEEMLLRRSTVIEVKGLSVCLFIPHHISKTDAAIDHQS